MQYKHTNTIVETVYLHVVPALYMCVESFENALIANKGVDLIIT